MSSSHRLARAAMSGLQKCLAPVEQACSSSGQAWSTAAGRMTLEQQAPSVFCRGGLSAVTSGAGAPGLGRGMGNSAAAFSSGSARGFASSASEHLPKKKFAGKASAAELGMYGVSVMASWSVCVELLAACSFCVAGVTYVLSLMFLRNAISCVYSRCCSIAQLLQLRAAHHLPLLRRQPLL